VDKIYELDTYFRDEDWASLNDSKLRQIDFRKLIGRKIKFDKIVGSSPERKLMLFDSAKVKKSTSKQI
jgi:hypothetical protein